MTKLTVINFPLESKKLQIDYRNFGKIYKSIVYEFDTYYVGEISRLVNIRAKVKIIGD